MSDTYNFQLEQFEGPLDLLLFLIKKNEVNIYDIPITKITEQYLSFLQYSTTVNLENITEFLCFGCNSSLYQIKDASAGGSGFF